MSSTTGSRSMDGTCPFATVAGPGAATKSARPRRTWTSSARIESATSSAVSAPMSSPAGARQRGQAIVGQRGLVAQPRPDHVRARRRGDEPDVGGFAGERGGGRLLVPDALRGHDHVRRRLRIETGDIGRRQDPLGARVRVDVGDGIDDGHPPSGSRTPGWRALRRWGSCRPPRGPAREDVVPRRSPKSRRSGRS